MKDKSGAASLQAALDEADGELYRGALDALSEIGGAEADQSALQALKSKLNRVRQRAASHLSEKKLATANPALWQAYRAETMAAGWLAPRLPIVLLLPHTKKRRMEPMDS
jgi:HEAT repeat protein